MKYSILLTLLFITQSIYGSNQAMIRLVDAIAVQGPTIELGEIATIQCADPALKNRLLQVDLGEVPAMGKTKFVSSFRIQGILEKQGLGDVELLGTQSVVSTEFRKVPREEIRKFLRDWVRQQLGEERELDIRFTHIPAGWQVPTGEGVEFHVHHSGRDPVGRLALGLQVKQHNRIMANTRVRLEVNAYQLAYVLTSPLKRGEQLTWDKLTEKRAHIEQTSGMDVAQIDTVIGHTAKRNLPLGHVPKVTDFEAPIAIERGSLNRLIVENGSVRLSITGAQALQDGRPGDLILFQNPVNRKEPLRARVVKPGLGTIKIR